MKRRFIITFAAAMLPLVSACGMDVPEIQEAWEGENATLFEAYVKSHVYCELQQAVEHSDVTIDKPGEKSHMALPSDWGVQVTISFQVDETGALNPGLALIDPLKNMQSYTTALGATLSRQAERVDKYEFYYSVSSLKRPLEGKGNVDCSVPANSSPLSVGSLRISEWLESALFFDTHDPSSRVTSKADSVFKQDVLSYETKFIGISTGTISPQWKLVRVATNQSAAFASANRTRTHDLIITFGPSQKPGAPGKKPAPGGPSEPAVIASNSHLASEIGLAVSNDLASRISQ